MSDTYEEPKCPKCGKRQWRMTETYNSYQISYELNNKGSWRQFNTDPGELDDTTIFCTWCQAYLDYSDPLYEKLKAQPWSYDEVGS